MGFAFIEIMTNCSIDETLKKINTPGLAIYNSKTNKVLNWKWENPGLNPPTHDQLLHWMKDVSEPNIPEFDEKATRKVLFEAKDAIVYFSKDFSKDKDKLIKLDRVR